MKKEKQRPTGSRKQCDHEGPSSPSRRRFIRNFGAAAAAASLAPFTSAAARTALPDVLSSSSKPLNLKTRPAEAYQKRLKAALSDRKIEIPSHPNNGDEAKYSSGIANYTKGFAHDRFGEVNPAAYALYLAAIKTGQRKDFDSLPIGGTVPLVDPQAGLAFDLETCDPSQNSIPPFDTLASPAFASQMIESYWLALTRDVPFSEYESDSSIGAAALELTSLPGFEGPRISGQVSPQSLFRGFTAGDLIGPYISQLFVQPFTYGAIPFVGYTSTLSGDFGTDVTSWLKIQNGQKPFAVSNPDPTLRYLRNGRDLAEYVHNDVLYQAYLIATLMLMNMRAPLNSGNPYYSLVSEAGFITFGFARSRCWLLKWSHARSRTRGSRNGSSIASCVRRKPPVWYISL